MKRVRARQQRIAKVRRHRKLTSPVTAAAFAAAMEAGDNVEIIRILDVSPVVAAAILAAEDDE